MEIKALVTAVVQKIKSYPKLLVVLIALIGLSSLLPGCDGRNGSDFFEVEVRDVVRTVEVSGRVQAAEDIELSFEQAGILTELAVNANDKVEKGDRLATIANEDLAAQRQDAIANVANLNAQLKQFQAGVNLEKAQMLKLQAVLDKENITLADLKTGNRQEDIDIAQVAVSNAQRSLGEAEQLLQTTEAETAQLLSNLYGSVPQTLESALSTSGDVLDRLLDDFFRNERNFQADLTFVSTNITDVYSAESQRNQLGRDLQALEQKDLFSTDPALVQQNILELQNFMQSIRALILTLDRALDGHETDSTTMDNFRTDLNTARTNLNTQQTALVDLNQSITSRKLENERLVSQARDSVTFAENTLFTAQDNLNLVKAGATPAQIQQQEAVVKTAEADLQTQDARIAQAEANVEAQFARIAQARAGLSRIDALINKTIIRAPISGIITRSDFTEGEFISASVPVLTMISDSKFEIQVDVPEVDIAKLEVGNPAEVTLDAYSDSEIFLATITEIEIAAREENSLPRYRVTLQFAEQDERIKAGMTANLFIESAKAEAAVAVPSRAIKKENGTWYVDLVDQTNAANKESILIKEVTTGITGSDGYVEITSGLKAGDLILMP